MVEDVCRSVQWVYLNIPFSSLSFPLTLFPSLLPFTVRKGHLWRFNSVQPGANTDGHQQQFQQWVNLQSGDSLRWYLFMCMWKVQELCRELPEEGKCRFVTPISDWSSLQFFDASLKTLDKGSFSWKIQGSWCARASDRAFYQQNRILELNVIQRKLATKKP